MLCSAKRDIAPHKNHTRPADINPQIVSETSTYMGTGAPLAILCIGPLGNLVFARDAAWPTPGKPVLIVVPFPACSGSDGLACTIARKFNEDTGGHFVVDKKPSVGTLTGAQVVARAANDSHTLFYTIVVTQTQNPHFYSKLPYDRFKDFTPFTQVARTPRMLVANKESPSNPCVTWLTLRAATRDARSRCTRS